ncbi:MAG: hypothetical protein DCC75_11650, partial [Proteobacteria bacterium]
MKSLSGLFFWPIFAYFTALGGAQAQTVKLGVITPLSGPVSWVGESVKNAVLLAQRDHPRGRNFEFIFEDSQFIAKTSLTAAKKLVELDGAKGLIVFGSTPAPAVSAFAEPSRIPNLGICIAEEFLKGKDYSFRMMPRPAVFNEQVVAEIKRRAYPSVAIVTTSQDGMLALRDGLTASKAVEIKLDQEVLPDERDFKSLSARIAVAKPGAVYAVLLPPQISIFSKQLREVGFEGDIFGAPPFILKEERESAGSALHGSWFVSFDDEAADKFYADYEREHRTTPPPEAIYGY